MWSTYGGGRGRIRGDRWPPCREGPCHEVPHSFSARPAQWRAALVDEDDHAPLHKAAPVVLAVLLQSHGDCSAAEAEQ